MLWCQPGIQVYRVLVGVFSVIVKLRVIFGNLRLKLYSTQLIVLNSPCCPKLCPTEKFCFSSWPRAHRGRGRGRPRQSVMQSEDTRTDDSWQMFLTSLTWSAAATSRKLQSKSFAKMSPTMIIIVLNNEDKYSSSSYYRPSSEDTCLRWTMSPLFPNNTRGTSLLWLLLTSWKWQFCFQTVIKYSY